eukprot:14295554-Alexandrium_andersonii.AAC.1
MSSTGRPLPRLPASQSLAQQPPVGELSKGPTWASDGSMPSPIRPHPAVPQGEAATGPSAG